MIFMESIGIGILQVSGYRNRPKIEYWHWYRFKFWYRYITNNYYLHIAHSDVIKMDMHSIFKALFYRVLVIHVVYNYIQKKHNCSKN